MSAYLKFSRTKTLGELWRLSQCAPARVEPPAAKERGVKTIAIRTQPDPHRLAHLAQAAAEKRLVVPVERTFPIEQAAEAFRLARSGAVGKVLLRP